MNDVRADSGADLVNPLLCVRDLAVDFVSEHETVHAVRGVNFDVFKGRTLAIVGESGSGKSVSAQAIMGILPKRGRIGAGSIVFHDPKTHLSTDISKLDRNAREMRALRGGRIAMIFQEPMTSLSLLHTVGDQVTEALRLHEPVSATAARERAEHLFERVGFKEPARTFDAYPFELSGGQRQRAMIAMALICKPALLIADEPTTALDVTTQAQILDLMDDLKAEFGMGLMLITHDLGVVANMADDVAVMYRGKVMEAGPVNDIFRDPRHPYLKALMGAVPHFDMPKGARLTPLRAIPVDGRKVLEDVERPRQCPAGRPVLEVQNVSKRFHLRGGMFGANKGHVQALTGVDLRLPAGRTLGIVGESGSGKTTLSKIIMRAMLPDEGRILFDDGSGPADVLTFTGERLNAYRRSVQFVFQDPFASLNPRMTVYDILSEPMVIHGSQGSDERYRRVKSILDLVGLGEGAMKRYPHSFSGGQRQRVGLARALMLSPAVIICDEPTSALDVSVQAQVLNLLKDLQATLGLSFIFVTHNLAVVDYMADEIAVMCRGYVVEQGPKASVLKAPAHPYTRALLAACPTPDLDRPLNFEALKASGLSNPLSWPAPFGFAQAADLGLMAELTPNHLVRLGTLRESSPQRKTA